MSVQKASASVIVSGVLAILGSLFFMLCLLLGLMGLYLTPPQRDVPANFASLAAVMLAFLFPVAILGILTGLGLFRLKNWARISALIWAGLLVFFNSITVIVLLFMAFPAVPSAPNVNVGVVKVIGAVIYGVPILIGVWWLVLFNSTSIKMQFVGISPALSPDVPVQPRCPLPIAIIAGFMLSSVLAMFAVPLMHLPISVIMFGERLRGELGGFLYALSAVLYLAAAIGLLRLKRWSYLLSIGLHAFWMISGVVTFLRPNYAQNMQEILSQIHMPETSTASLQLLHNPVFAVFIMFPGVLILSLLFYYRKRFLAASSSANSSV
jgi:hypothetical protein